MLAKLITLPIASAIASASSQPPVLRIEARVSKITKTAKNATTVSLPSANSHATRTVRCGRELQMVADEQRDRDVRPLINAWIGETMILKATMVQVGMK